MNPNGVIKVGNDLVQAGGGGFFLDPTKVPTNINDGMQYLIFGRLLRPLTDGSLEPDLAQSATIVDTNTIEIKVRAGQTFQDGTPFDAAAVQAGLQRSLDSKSDALGARFFSLKTITVTGTDTVTLGFTDGSAPSWYDLLGSWETTIVKPGTNFEAPIGAGPMKVTDYKAGESLTMAKYDGFWQADQVKLAGMQFVHIESAQPQTATAALKAGQADVVPTDPTQMSSFTGNYDVFESQDEAAVTRINFCKSQGPLANEFARKAVNNAIDREAVSAGAYEGAAAPADQMFPEDSLFYNDAVGDDLGYDQAAAKQALVDAGMPNGFEFTLYVPNGLGMPEVGQVMQQQLQQVGITMTLKVTANQVEEFTGANIAGASLSPGSVSGRAKLPSFTGDSLANVCDYNNPELTALINQLQGVNETSDEGKVLWDKITDIIYGDALGGWLVFRSQLAAYNTTIVGDLQMWPKGLSRIPLVYTTYIKK